MQTFRKAAADKALSFFLFQSRLSSYASGSGGATNGGCERTSFQVVGCRYRSYEYIAMGRFVDLAKLLCRSLNF